MALQQLPLLVLLLAKTFLCTRQPECLVKLQCCYSYSSPAHSHSPQETINTSLQCVSQQHFALYSCYHSTFMTQTRCSLQLHASLLRFTTRPMPAISQKTSSTSIAHYSDSVQVMSHYEDYLATSTCPCPIHPLRLAVLRLRCGSTGVAIARSVATTDVHFHLDYSNRFITNEVIVEGEIDYFLLLRLPAR